jgi:thiamine biosynthesis lipoprotein
MGTEYNIKFFIKDKSKNITLKIQIDETLISINNEMSTYQKDSEISYFNKFDRLGPVKISEDFFYVTKYSLSLAHKTNGQYDPTIGPLVNLWGFGPDGKRKVPNEKELEKVKKYVGHYNITLNEKDRSITKKIKGVYLDLSSSAKGFAVDKIAKLLDSKNLSSYMIEIGGEVRTKGFKLKKKPWKIAIDSPAPNTSNNNDKHRYTKAINLINASLATSGNYRNFFTEAGKKYSHTIDFNTGKPVVNKLASVSIISKEGCMQADALATAFMAMGLEKALKYADKYNIPAYFIYDKGNVLVTKESKSFLKYQVEHK